MLNRALMLVAAGAWISGIGSGCSTEPVSHEPMETHSHDPRAAYWDDLSTDELLSLFERSDRNLERRVIGGFDTDVYDSALYQIERRLGDAGLSTLTPSQRERFLRQLRVRISNPLSGQGVMSAGAKYAPEFTAEYFLKHPFYIEIQPTDAIDCLRRAGREDDMWRLLNTRLDSLDERTVREGLDWIERCKLDIAADAVYKRTRALRWLIRLQALRTLDAIDDPRTTEALARCLGDIKRHGIGLRILSFISALEAFSSSQCLRSELMEALARRRVPGAEDALEYILMNSGEPYPPLRCAAAHSLAQLDRNRAIGSLRKLLQSKRAADRLVAAMGAEWCHAIELENDIRALRNTEQDKDIRQALSQTLDSLKRSAPERD